MQHENVSNVEKLGNVGFNLGWLLQRCNVDILLESRLSTTFGRHSKSHGYKAASFTRAPRTQNITDWLIDWLTGYYRAV